MTDSSTMSRDDSTRARLLAAAVDAFATKGFHATTTREIAAAAGVSPAALYVHHESKEELLYLIALDGHRDSLSALQEVALSTDDPREQLRRAVYSFAERHARHHTVARVINHELRGLASFHLAEIREMRRRTDAEFRAIIERGVRAGVFRFTDAALTATTLLSLGIDISRWYRDGGPWTPEYVATRYAEMALLMLGSPSERPRDLGSSIGPRRSPDE